MSIFINSFCSSLLNDINFSRKSLIADCSTTLNLNKINKQLQFFFNLPFSNGYFFMNF